MSTNPTTQRPLPTSQHETRGTRRTVRAIVQNVSLALGVLIIALILADVALPLFHPMTKTTLIFDPLLGLKGRPGITTIWTREVDRPLWVKLNSSGFHDREHPMQKPANTFRIVALGDSFVEAYQVPMESNFPNLLAQNLNQRVSAEAKGASTPGHVEILNQGIHGYGLGSYYLYVNHRLDAWSPDMLLLCMFLGNDLEDNYYPLAAPAVPRFRIVDGRMDFVPPRFDFSTRVRDSVLAHSNLAMLVRESSILGSSLFVKFARNNSLLSWSNLQPLSDAQKSEMLELAGIQLSSIQQHLNARHVKFFVLVIPDPYRVMALVNPQLVPHGTNYVSPEDRVVLERGLLNILELDKIPYEYPLDQFVSEVRQGQAMYIQSAGHLTLAGHRKVAELIEQPVWNMAQQK